MTSVSFQFHILSFISILKMVKIFLKMYAFLYSNCYINPIYLYPKFNLDIFQIITKVCQVCFSA